MTRFAHLCFCLTFALAAVHPAAARADGFSPVHDRDRFVAIVQHKELRNFLFGIRLNVAADGAISGSALGWDVTGNWDWRDGYFCREMAWGGDPIPFNCQLVEADNAGRVRFTVDQGAGDSATFRLR